MAPQVAGNKSLGQRCNVHSAMVLRALEDTGLVMSYYLVIVYLNICLQC